MTQKVWIWAAGLYCLLMAPIAGLAYVGAASRHPQGDEPSALVMAAFIFGLPLAVVGSMVLIWEMGRAAERVIARLDVLKGKDRDA